MLGLEKTITGSYKRRSQLALIYGLFLALPLSCIFYINMVNAAKYHGSTGPYLLGVLLFPLMAFGFVFAVVAIVNSIKAAKALYEYHFTQKQSFCAISICCIIGVFATIIAAVLYTIAMIMFFDL